MKKLMVALAALAVLILAGCGSTTKVVYVNVSTVASPTPSMVASPTYSPTYSPTPVATPTVTVDPRIEQGVSYLHNAIGWVSKAIQSAESSQPWTSYYNYCSKASANFNRVDLSALRGSSRQAALAYRYAQLTRKAISWIRMDAPAWLRGQYATANRYLNLAFKDRNLAQAAYKSYEAYVASIRN